MLSAVLFIFAAVVNVVAVFLFFLQNAMADPRNRRSYKIFCILVVSGFVLYVPSRIANFVAVGWVFEPYDCLVRSTVDISSAFLASSSISFQFFCYVGCSITICY